MGRSACDATGDYQRMAKRSMTASGCAALALSISGVLAAFGAAPAGAADITAREVTTTLFAARGGIPPDFSRKDLSYLDLSGLDLSHVRMTASNLYGTDFSEALLNGADLAHAKLDRATITRADFSGANLEGATLLRPTVHTSFQYDTRDAPRFVGAKLAGLRVMARLDGADFSEADLSGANFTGLEARAGQGTLTTRGGNDLLSCDFSRATLRGADFTNANLTFSKFVGADLRGANLTDADLSKVDLTGADLSGVDLTRANLYGAVLTGVVGFDSVRGLDQAVNLDKAVR